MKRGNHIVHAATIYFGQGARTCNEAEMECLVRAMKYLSTSKVSKNGEVVNIMGDSRLVVSFMNREFSPNKKALALGVNTCRELARRIPGSVKYYHVYRENNTVADYLSKLALNH